jgi:hypothetical protein
MDVASETNEAPEVAAALSANSVNAEMSIIQVCEPRARSSLKE